LNIYLINAFIFFFFKKKKKRINKVLYIISTSCKYVYLIYQYLLQLILILNKITYKEKRNIITFIVDMKQNFCIVNK